MDVAIRHFFNSLDYFKDEFTKTAIGRFGRRWTWLVVTDGLLSIISTPNHDNPMVRVAELKGIPIIGNEIWEHAYYM